MHDGARSVRAKPFLPEVILHTAVMATIAVAAMTIPVASTGSSPSASGTHHDIVFAPSSAHHVAIKPIMVAGEATSCDGDVNIDGIVNVADLLALLAVWGQCADPSDCPADLSGDGQVNVADLLQLLGAWGPCPNGACCVFDSGSCNVLTQAACENTGGTYTDDGTTCEEANCPPLGLCEGNCGGVAVHPAFPDGFCLCDDLCEVDDLCCPGVCDDCPEIAPCNPASICDNATGNCCVGNDSPGCNNQDCCTAVCGCDPFCCEGVWDPFCATEGACSAQALCPQCGGGCGPVSCTNNEGESCGALTNDGCNIAQPAFGSIACGETICGNLWAAASPEFPNGQRDTDWFLLDLSSETGQREISWSVSSEFPVQLFILSAECPTEVLEGPIEGCPASITACLDPGEYILFVAPTSFLGLPCPGFNYEAVVTCDDTPECGGTQPGPCDGHCGGMSPDGCMCDDLCCFVGDCCPGACNECPSICDNFCAECPECPGCPDDPTWCN